MGGGRVFRVEAWRRVGRIGVLWAECVGEICWVVPGQICSGLRSCVERDFLLWRLRRRVWVLQGVEIVVREDVVTWCDGAGRKIGEVILG